jgi:predicted transcriptional regulator
MSTTTVNPKQLVIDTIRRLPDSVTLDQIADQIDTLAHIEEGIRDADNGRVKTPDQVRELITQWTTK